MSLKRMAEDFIKEIDVIECSHIDLLHRDGDRLNKIRCLEELTQSLRNTVEEAGKVIMLRDQKIEKLEALAVGAQAARETITLLRGDIEKMQQEKDRQSKTIRRFQKVTGMAGTEFTEEKMYMWQGKHCSKEIFDILSKQEKTIAELNDALSKADLVATTQMLNGQQDLIDDLKERTEAQRKTIVEYQKMRKLSPAAMAKIWEASSEIFNLMDDIRPAGGFFNA